MKLRFHPSKIVGFLFLSVLSFIILIPFIWLFLSSLKSNAQYFKRPIEWFPSPALWDNYVQVFWDLKFYHYIWNSVFLATVTVILAVISSSFIAYGFARFQFPGKDAMFIIVIATMMLPTQVTMIPQFIFFKEIGWLTSFLPLTVPLIFGSSFVIFLLRQFFITISREMDEAAKIDGCSAVRIWWSIVMPQAKPALIVASLFVFLYSFRDVFGPLIYLNDKDLYTVAIGLLFFTSPTYNQYSLLLAGVVIALIPTLIIFMLSQRYMDNGIHIAAIK